MIRNWIDYNEVGRCGFALLKQIYSMVLVLLIAVAAFNLVATLIMVVMEKRKDIAVLISMGATRRDVRRIFVLKGLIVGAVGTSAGDSWRNRMLRAGALPFHSYLERNLRHLDRADLRQSVNFVSVAVASMFLCFLATLYPARQASREMPVEVFRS